MRISDWSSYVFSSDLCSRSSPFRGSSTRAALNKIDIKKFSDCSAKKSAGFDYRNSSLEAGSVKSAYNLACEQRHVIRDCVYINQWHISRRDWEPRRPAAYHWHTRG